MDDAAKVRDERCAELSVVELADRFSEKVELYVFGSAKIWINECPEWIELRKRLAAVESRASQ